MNSDGRYKGHLNLCEIDLAGQKRLRDSSVLVVGCGGLASTALEYLASAGTGSLGLVDDDIVEVHNLQRQLLFSQADTGMPKVEAAASRLKTVNPDTITRLYPRLFTAETAGEIIGSYQWDVCLDCTDSYASKRAVAEACVAEGLPVVYGAVSRFSGQVMTWLPGHACYGCLYGLEEPSAEETSCSDSGIFNAVVGITGIIQAAEAIKLIIGFGDLLTDRLLTIDTLTMQFHTVAIGRNPECPLCKSENS